MERFEYRVVSFAEGTYTSMLNQYAVEGWELADVVPEIRTVPARREERLPMPGLGKLGQAAQAVSKLGEPDERDAPEPGSITTTFLWVLRRRLGDD